MSKRVNYEDFVIKHDKPQGTVTYVLASLTQRDQDGKWILPLSNGDHVLAVGKVSVNPEGVKSYALKRTISNKLFNPLDYTPNTESDIRYKTYRSEPRWSKVSAECYKRYMEFLETGSRLALNLAEREYASI